MPILSRGQTATNSLFETFEYSLNSPTMIRKKQRVYEVLLAKNNPLLPS